jgi:hypothetical protein
MTNSFANPNLNLTGTNDLSLARGSETLAG